MSKSWECLVASNGHTKPLQSSRERNECRAGAVAPVNEWRALCKKYGCCCLSCGVVLNIDLLTRDHIVPLCLPWSSNGIENLQPLCGRCNGHKKNQVIDFRPDFSSIVPKQLSGGLKQIWREREKRDTHLADAARIAIITAEQKQAAANSVLSKAAKRAVKKARGEADGKEVEKAMLRVAQLHEQWIAVCQRASEWKHRAKNAESDLGRLRAAIKQMPWWARWTLKRTPMWRQMEQWRAHDAERVEIE